MGRNAENKGTLVYGSLSDQLILMSLFQRMNHQIQTHQMMEQHLIAPRIEHRALTNRPNVWGRVLPRAMAIATILGALGSGLSSAIAVPIPEAAPEQDSHASANALSDTVLVPNMADLDLDGFSSTPADAPQTLAQTPSESTLDPTPDSSEDDESKFGDRGDNRWYVQAGAATTLDDDEARRLGLVGAGLSHFFLNGHSINLELNGLAFDQTGDDAVGLNLNAMLRWHLYRADDWSVYVDGGAGLLGTTNDVPAAGSQLNFTPQVGAGATIRLKDEQRLMVGLRWHHISNADLYPPNPGRDSLYGYVGWNFPR